MSKLSVVIPSRNEMFLSRTIEDIVEHCEEDTEVIVVLDGAWAEPPIVTHPRVKIIFFPESIGQRATTNAAVKLSTSKYIMKVDAHCAFDQGFDKKMIEAFEKSGDNVTMIPVMRNLHAFNWVCEDGHIRYQGPSGPCQTCQKETKRDVVWIPKTNPQSTSYCFDTTLHFQYFNEFKKKPEGTPTEENNFLTETMSIQGSCFMMTREKYIELGIDDVTFGSWGQQGVEVACKTWLSGGRVLVNHKTWYAHMFRTQGGDFSFPYPQDNKQVDHARKYSRDLFMEGKWDKAKYPLTWLIEKFSPDQYWKKEDIDKLKGDPTKGILFYTNNRMNMKLAGICRNNLLKMGLPITSVSLKPMNFGKNIHFKGESGYLTMFKQILVGLEAMTQNIVFFAEHDVLYDKSHFDFTPTNKNTFYYNGHYWFLRVSDGFAVHYDASPLSGLVVFREAAIKHFKERIKMIEELGDAYKPLHMGFEPFTHGRVKWEYNCNFEVFQSKVANIDIAHGANSTWKRWKQEDFIKKPKIWEESTVSNIPGWEKLEEKINFFSEK
jgi:glycosyltransferase involved in cell wall biosynthesis